MGRPCGFLIPIKVSNPVTLLHSSVSWSPELLRAVSVWMSACVVLVALQVPLGVQHSNKIPEHLRFTPRNVVEQLEMQHKKARCINRFTQCLACEPTTVQTLFKKIVSAGGLGH